MNKENRNISAMEPYDLIEQKDFAHLTKNEQAAILAQISEAEYTLLRALVQDAGPAMLAPNGVPDPNPEILTKLRAKVKEERTWRARIRSLVSHRIPAYQAAAAALLLGLAIHMGSGIEQDSTTESQQVGFSLADSSRTDSATKVGMNLFEDSVFSRFMIEAL